MRSVERTCEYCGATFVQVNNLSSQIQKYCGHGCLSAARKKYWEKKRQDNAGITSKVCSCCKVEKPIAEFVRDYRIKHVVMYRAQCKDCLHKKGSVHHSQHKDDAKYRRIKQTYGLSREQYDNLLEQQDYKCYICRQEFTRPHVDHDHETGEVRSILCHRCNTCLGLMGEDIELLSRLITYLCASRAAKLEGLSWKDISSAS